MRNFLMQVVIAVGRRAITYIITRICMLRGLEDERYGRANVQAAGRWLCKCV